MDALAAGLALVSAVLHASWNAIVKVRGDRMVALAMVTFFGGIAATPLVIWAEPMNRAAVPFLVGTVAVHVVYFYALVESYRVADLSHAYPLARGSAPLMLALAAPLTLGETLHGAEILGILGISAGIVLLVRMGPGFFADWRKVVFPLLTGLSIATYSTLDARGVRISGSPFAYIGWLFLAEALTFPLYALWRRPLAVKQAITTSAPTYIAGGLMVAAGYGLVLYAFSIGSAAHVAALRETGVILAALIGTRLLKEPFGARRVVAAILVALGAIVLELGG